MTVDIKRKSATELALSGSQARAYDAVFKALDNDAAVASSFLGIASAAQASAAVQQMLPDHAGGTFATVPVPNDATLQPLLQEKNVRYEGRPAEEGNLLVYILVQTLPFLLILGMNLLGMMLTFTVTSQLAITATFAIITFGLVLLIGVFKNGIGFLKLFWPTGAPLVMRPVVGFIELISFFLRPLTLALRLFGNMMGGHVALKVFAGFVVVSVGGAIGWLGVPVMALSLGMTVGLTALEFLVAFLQAFVFAVLTTIYLNDVVNLGHGH